MGKTKYVWEIVSLVWEGANSITSVQKKYSMLVVAGDIQQIWDYLVVDRADERTEIESIIKIGPVVTILENEKLDSTK